MTGFYMKCSIGLKWVNVNHKNPGIKVAFEKQMDRYGTKYCIFDRKLCRY